MDSHQTGHIAVDLSPEEISASTVDIVDTQPLIERRNNSDYNINYHRSQSLINHSGGFTIGNIL